MLPTAPVADDDALDLRAYLAVLRRTWKRIVAIVVLAVAVAMAFSLQQEPRYRAESELLIRQSDSVAVVEGALASSASDPARRLNNEVRLFESGLVRSEVATRYNGPLDPDDVEASVDTEGSDVLVAAVTSTDPDQAAELVNVYAETFIEVRRQRLTDEMLAVGEQIQRKIDDIDAQLTDLGRPLAELDAAVAADPGNAGLVIQREAVSAQITAQSGPLQGQRAFYAAQLEDVELSAQITGAGGAGVLTRAEPPEAPIGPKPVRDVSIALALGCVIGIGVALLTDTLDDRIRGVAELEQVSGGLPTLAVVPLVDKRHTGSFVAVRDDPRSLQAEAFRSLRTAVKFAGIEHSVKVIQVTSASQSEGKTTTAANLAVALAQGGDRVVVVSCDLRRPRVQDYFDAPLSPGLTDVVVDEVLLSQALKQCGTNICLLPAGTPTPNPSELLSSTRASSIIRALAADFDVVLVDSTPVLPVTDALVVSRFVDVSLVVVDIRTTPRKAVSRSLQVLSQVNAPVLGIVLNGLPEGSGLEYGFGYGYGRSYESDHSQPKRPRRTKRRDARQERAARVDREPTRSKTG